MSVKNYKAIIAYDGSRYFGWEHQPGQELTIQGKLEGVLSRLAEREVEVIGAGRTDAGVHARAMVCNFRLDTELSADGIRDYMNRYLPDDISVNELKEASDRFHARYNATGKTYIYTLYVGRTKPVFDRKYVYIPEEMPDLDLMRASARLLMGTHDFAAFQANPHMKKSTVRNVDRIDIEKNGDYVRLTFHGSGFMQHMVRILTGTMLEVGYGKRAPENITELLETGKRSMAGFTAPARGLCLEKVDY